ncbi:zinc dependent phospholipase C family protein [Clostridium sp. MSJ-11]|uniref:Zinc dependent phospholipase C family protein n=1 Tax=Clostridium mobile TaxID=2841512 RepID=A0ABS6EFY9_9CLOT|nr:zinc dependent phospholipase C family protein [Clostridium mobile]MBU5483385.1 zinc dependent phospholipase C family protein [Clostridium mobile]
MPGAWTHVLGASKVSSDIEDVKYKNIIKQNNKMYQYGAQGPDIFLYYCIFIPSKHNRVKKLGQRMHTDKTREFIMYFVDKAKETKTKEDFECLLSYTLGFVTHYALDTTMHPFIYYFGGIYHPDTVGTRKYDFYHRELENIIGMLELEDIRGKNKSKGTIHNEIDIGKKVPRVLEETYSSALYEVYSLKIKDYLLQYCYKDMKSSFKFVMDTNLGKNILLSLLEIVINKKNKAKILLNPEKIIHEYDYLNKNHVQWNHPCNLKEKTKKSAEDLYEEGVKKGSDMVEAIINYLEDKIDKSELEKLIPNLSYESGKPLEEYKKMIYFDCIFEKDKSEIHPKDKNNS